MEEKTNKKGIIIFTLLVILVITIVTVILFMKNTPKTEKEIIECIASKSYLYVSKLCPHCADQKQILGSNILYFNMTDCFVNFDRCSAAGIEGYPTWIIDNKKYLGVRTIEELKTISNC